MPSVEWGTLPTTAMEDRRDRFGTHELPMLFGLLISRHEKFIKAFVNRIDNLFKYAGIRLI